MTALTQCCDWRFFCRDFRFVLQAYAGISYKTIGAATVAGDGGGVAFGAISVSTDQRSVPTGVVVGDAEAAHRSAGRSFCYGFTNAIFSMCALLAAASTLAITSYSALGSVAMRSSGTLPVLACAASCMRCCSELTATIWPFQLT